LRILEKESRLKSIALPQAEANTARIPGCHSEIASATRTRFEKLDAMGRCASFARDRAQE